MQVVLLLAFLLPEIGKLGTSCPWFCEIWVGYGLMASGLLLLERTVEDKTLALISIGGAAAIALVLLEWSLDLRLIGRTVALAEAHRALCAVLSIVAGLVGFVLLARVTTGCLERSNLPESVPE